jgi:signal transduction histidine kinase
MKALQSIRIRLLLFAAIGTIVAVAVASAGLVALFGRHVERRVEQELDSQIAAIAGNVRIEPGGALAVAREPSDPRFRRPFGGLYWQVLDEKSGKLLRSVSLWDSRLDLPDDPLAIGGTHTHRSTAPDRQQVILHERRVLLGSGPDERPIRISVAVNETETDQLKAGFGRDLVPGLALLGALLLVAAWLQVGAGLKPLASIRSALSEIREGRSSRLSLSAPSEIAPLVGEFNDLLKAQEAALDRARNRAADLAHGLKTPLTALSADIQRLRAGNHNELADDIEAVSFQMQRIVERELARSRRRHDGQRQRTVLGASAEAIARTLARTPAGEAVAWEIEIDAGLAVAADIDDVNDVLGNLMENAARSARARVRVRAQLDGRVVQLSVADDGGPVDPQRIAGLISRGKRLDESGGAAGLGLAIVGEILEVYESEPSFSVSDLGGLDVRFSLPAAHA